MLGLLGLLGVSDFVWWVCLGWVVLQGFIWWLPFVVCFCWCLRGLCLRFPLFACFAGLFGGCVSYLVGPIISFAVLFDFIVTLGVARVGLGLGVSVALCLLGVVCCLFAVRTLFRGGFYAGLLCLAFISLLCYFFYTYCV